MQLKVIKNNGSTERYLHTKVMGTFSNALALVDQASIFTAEQFTEAITFYLYEKRDTSSITSNRIHLMVQSVLRATGFINASEALNEYRLERRLNRSRIEVVDDKKIDVGTNGAVCQWNKSVIVNDIIREFAVSGQMARAIAAAVEEKILKLGMSRIRRSLIKEFVAADMDVMLRAEMELRSA